MASINALEKLSHLTVLKIKGADASGFLQGQLSNDVNAIENQWQFSGYCSPKGRLIALLQLWQVNGDDAIYALIDSSIVESTVKRLRMYVMRSKVVIEILENAACYARYSPDLNGPRFSIINNQQSHSLNYRGRQLLVDFADSIGRSNSDSEQKWQAHDIEDGLPNINSDTSELFVPQMVNLDLLDGINFKKGCYTGQEIVARMHYLGKLKQRMYVCSSNDTSTIKPGAKILSNGKNAGNVVAAVGSSLTAVLRTEFIEEKSEFHIETDEKITVKANQPYEISALLT